MHTRSPSASAASMRWLAPSSIFGSSRAGAIAIALAVLKNQFISGILKIRWSMTKRIGRGLAPMISTASTKLT